MIEDEEGRADQGAMAMDSITKGIRMRSRKGIEVKAAGPSMATAGQED